jgi:DNA-binding NtrC family response regulator
MSARILIINSDVEAATALSREASEAGHEVVTAGDAASARLRVSTFSPDVVVLTWQLPDATGLALLEELRGQLTQSVFVLVSDQPDPHRTVEALEHGAFDCVSADTEPHALLMRIERAAEHALLRRVVAEAHAEWATQIEFVMLGDSPAMEQLRSRIEALAASDETAALITGESGVGKSVLARAIHLKSRRSNEPFVVVDCASVAPSQLDAELFGHEPAASTDSTPPRPGRLEAAQGGTLFLDEITELDAPLQQKLLRLLEEGEYVRAGGGPPRKFDARVIASTSRDLGRAVEEGRFREDLRQRLERVKLVVPPLRERGEDVFLLADRYATQRARAQGRTRPVLAAEVREALATYPFPGNVRELCAMIDEALWLHHEDTLTLDDFPVLLRYRAESEGRSAFGSSPPRSGLMSTLPQGASGLRMTANAPPPSLGVIRERHADQERIKLVEALEQSGGNVSRAARQVGMSRYQMLRRLAKYGLR